jgi:phosphoglycolate phosphatase
LDDLALILFDVDGTLVDSQSEILAAMHDAFAAIAQPVPNRDAILSTVGLSLEQAMLHLLPSECDAHTISAAVSAYKHSYRKSERWGQCPYSILELRIYCANADRMKIGCLGLPRESRATG